MHKRQNKGNWVAVNARCLLQFSFYMQNSRPYHFKLTRLQHKIATSQNKLSLDLLTTILSPKILQKRLILAESLWQTVPNISTAGLHLMKALQCTSSSSCGHSIAFSVNYCSPWTSRGTACPWTTGLHLCRECSSPGLLSFRLNNPILPSHVTVLAALLDFILIYVSWRIALNI